MMKPTLEELIKNKYAEEDLNKWVDEFDKNDWEFVSTHQKLSEDFILNFKDKLNLLCVCYEQELSENFLEHNDIFCWGVVLSRQKYSAQLLVKIDILSHDKLNQITHNDGSMSTSEKIEFVFEIIKENKKMSEEEKQEIIDTLRLVRLMTN